VHAVGVGVVAPGAHPYPGAAAGHAAHVALLVAFTAADHVPAGQSVGADEPAGQKAPGGQPFAHVALLAAPTAADHPPAGQGDGLADPGGQKEPGVQATGAADASAQ